MLAEHRLRHVRQLLHGPAARRNDGPRQLSSLCIWRRNRFGRALGDHVADSADQRELRAGGAVGSHLGGGRTKASQSKMSSRATLAIEDRADEIAELLRCKVLAFDRRGE